MTLTSKDQAERYYESLRSELMLRGIEDAHVEDSGGGVYVVTGTLPNGHMLDAAREGFGFTDTDGASTLSAAYAVLQGGTREDGSIVADAPDYDALAVECDECGTEWMDEDCPHRSIPYVGSIHPDSAAFAASVIADTYRATYGASIACGTDCPRDMAHAHDERTVGILNGAGAPDSAPDLR